MKKKLLTFIATLVACLFMLCSCKKELPNNIKFLEFPQYKDFNGDISVIEVNFDINNDEAVRFDITDSNDIEVIINMVKDTTFTKAESIYDGNHSNISLIDSLGNTTKISLSQIKYGDLKEYYSYPDSSIYDYIKQVGIKLGKLS